MRWQCEKRLQVLEWIISVFHSNKRIKHQQISSICILCLIIKGIKFFFFWTFEEAYSFVACLRFEVGLGHFAVQVLQFRKTFSITNSWISMAQFSMRLLELNLKLLKVITARASLKGVQCYSRAKPFCMFQKATCCFCYSQLYSAQNAHTFAWELSHFRHNCTIGA